MTQPPEQIPTLIAWMQNYVQILQSIQKIMQVLSHQLPENSLFYDNTSWQRILENYSELSQALLKNPKKLLESQVELTKNFSQLWKSFFFSWSGFTFNPVLEDIPKDKRFRDPDWENNPFFAFIKESYLILGKYLTDLVYAAEDLDPAASKKLKFYTHQFIDALSPSNFILTNPEVLRTTLDTAGGNLALGLEKMLEDLKKNEGRFNVRMTDLNAFVIGKDLAITPGKVVFQNRLFQLIQYEPTTKEVYKTPVLIFPPWINKFYILDLRPKNSLVRDLLAQGQTVFMVSWVNPDESYSDTTFDDYLTDGALKAVEVTQTITSEKKINLMAYCIGGTLVGCLLAYLTAKKIDVINSVTLLATLLNFSEPGDIQVFIDEPQLKALDERMKKKGYLDGRDMGLTFNTLRANDLIWSYFINNYLSGKEPYALDLLYWNSDATNLPAPAHSFYLHEFYQNNNLCKANAITLSGQPLDLTKVHVPIYAVATEQDHIAPWRSVYEGLKCLAGEKRFVLGGSGHIAGIINPTENNKYTYRVCDTCKDKFCENPDDWYAIAQEKPGSWWTDWFEWLGAHAGEKIKARTIGSKDYPPIEDAPGSYVMKKVGFQDGK